MQLHFIFIPFRDKIIFGNGSWLLPFQFPDGHFSIVLQDGEEALDLLFGQGKFAGSRENYSLPKIILLDIQMPKINSLDVLKKIKADDRTNGTPVILLTSSGLHPDLHDCYELGASSYIVKPLNFERFAQAVQNLEFFWLLLNQAPR